MCVNHKNCGYIEDKIESDNFKKCKLCKKVYNLNMIDLNLNTCFSCKY